MAGIRQHGLRAILVVCSGYYIPRTRFRSCFIQSVDADQPVQQCITLSIAIVAEEQFERMVKYLKENFFVRYRRFDSFTHVNQQLELFDFTFQPSIDRKVVRELAGLAFVERSENVLMVGAAGIGKKHLTIALDVKEVDAGHRVLFMPRDRLIATLKKAKQENRL